MINSKNPTPRHYNDTESLEQLIFNYVDQVWNHANTQALMKLTTNDFIYHLGGNQAYDRAGMAEFLTRTHAAFPDWSVEILDIIAENNKATIRWQGQVTHLGRFYSLEPTGKKVSVSGINMYQIVNQKIAIEWEQTDSLNLLKQLGVFASIKRIEI